MTLSSRFARHIAISAVAFSGLVSTQAQAQGLSLFDIRLDTTAFDAVTTQQFSFDAAGASAAAGIIFGSAGTATEGAGMTNEFGDKAQSFFLPITSIVLSPQLIPFNVTNVKLGDATGAALTFNRRGSMGFTLANFTVDYQNSKVIGDFMTNGTSNRITVFNFKRQSNLAPRFDATGGLLGVQLNEVLGDLRLSTVAVDSFAAALRLSAPLKASLAGLDFGTLTQNINVNIRRPVDATPFTVAAVPEPSAFATMGLGLVGMAWLVSRRRRSS